MALATHVAVMPMSSPSRKPPAPERPVGIKDIAKALGISDGHRRSARCTPSRASTSVDEARACCSMAAVAGLSAEPGGAAGLETVKIDARGGAPAARAGRCSGIRCARASARGGRRRSSRQCCAWSSSSYPRLGEGRRRAVGGGDRADGMRGLIHRARRSGRRWRPGSKKAAQQQIPVICVVTDAPDTQRLASVSGRSLHGRRGGGGVPLTRAAAAAGRWRSSPAGSARRTTRKSVAVFEASLAGLRRAPRAWRTVVEAHDDEREDIGERWSCCAGISGSRGYVSTVNSLPVVRAVEREDRLRDVTLVTTDLFAELVASIRAGKVIATVYQRPERGPPRAAGHGANTWFRTHGPAAPHQGRPAPRHAEQPGSFPRTPPTRQRRPAPTRRPHHQAAPHATALNAGPVDAQCRVAWPLGW